MANLTGVPVSGLAGLRYTASQSSDGMAGVEGSVSATICHITAWAMASRTRSLHDETTTRTRYREFHCGRIEGGTWPGDDASTAGEASDEWAARYSNANR